jgi:hypothetical protein
MSGVATLVKRLDGWTGDARLYRLDPPTTTGKYVIVSATAAPFSGPETYIFAAREDGECEDYGELDGSYRGGLDHAEALRRAGYELMGAA